MAILHLSTNSEHPDISFKMSAFFNSRPPLTIPDLLMFVHELLVGLLTVVCNSLVVVLFVRVLGLRRLASNLIVSLAVSYIVFGLTILVHALGVMILELTNTAGKCRIFHLIDSSSRVLVWSCLACLVGERLLAINLHRQYLSSINILAATLLTAPWVSWVYYIAMSFSLSAVWLQLDIGYVCQHHLMWFIHETPTEYFLAPSKVCTAVLLLLLVMTCTLHPPHYDDVWEANRLQLEYKTTSITFKILLLVYVLWVPSALMILLMEVYPQERYLKLYISHAFYQVGIYQGLVLFGVLLSRKEFRGSFRYIFSKRDTIRGFRPPNYMVAASETIRRGRSVVAGGEECRTPVLVTARDDYRSLIDESELTNNKSRVQSRNYSIVGWFQDSQDPAS